MQPVGLLCNHSINLFITLHKLVIDINSHASKFWRILMLDDKEGFDARIVLYAPNNVRVAPTLKSTKIRKIIGDKRLGVLKSKNKWLQRKNIIKYSYQNWKSPI